ncbi:hypothetical protein F5884DRAFT_488547 [Xylogone sp. PMI_703]|nr:hypothetical protein F5884DRAFT_488547 [Xylogone sp. PMI_703]
MVLQLIAKKTPIAASCKPLRRYIEIYWTKPLAMPALLRLASYPARDPGRCPSGICMEAHVTEANVQTCNKNPRPFLAAANADSRWCRWVVTPFCVSDRNMQWILKGVKEGRGWEVIGLRRVMLDSDWIERMWTWWFCCTSEVCARERAYWSVRGVCTQEFGNWMERSRARTFVACLVVCFLETCIWEVFSSRGHLEYSLVYLLQ